MSNFILRILQLLFWKAENKFLWWAHNMGGCFLFVLEKEALSSFNAFSWFFFWPRIVSLFFFRFFTKNMYFGSKKLKWTNFKWSYRNNKKNHQENALKSLRTSVSKTWEKHFWKISQNLACTLGKTWEKSI